MLDLWFAEIELIDRRCMYSNFFSEPKDAMISGVRYAMLLLKNGEDITNIRLVRKWWEDYEE